MNKSILKIVIFILLIFFSVWGALELMKSAIQKRREIIQRMGIDGRSNSRHGLEQDKVNKATVKKNGNINRKNPSR